MESTLFVVADQSQAQLYRVSGTKLNPELEDVGTIDHPEAHGKFDEASSGMHMSFVDVESSEAEEERRFVRQVVEHLHKRHSDGEFRRLYIAAPANFVGKIRGLYSSALAQAVSREIVGNFTRENARTLTERIKKKRWLD
jgi:protein required for attachment to host cells